MPRMSVTRTRGERAVTAAPPALLAPMLSLSEQIAGQLAARITAGTFARRGAQITKLSISEVREIFDIRGALNGLRDRAIAEDPQRAKVLPMLEKEVAELARLARDTRHSDEYVERVFKLNRALTAVSRSARLRAILEALAQQTLRYSRLGLASDVRRRQSVRHWQELVKAVREGDGERAQRAAEERVRASRDEAIKKLRELSEN
jgi:DNA-binding GntR family transcriptional regulator